jgi:hypothetical protein
LEKNKKIMDIKSLKLLKIQYNLTIDELDKLLFGRMSEEEKKWTYQLSQQVPNESIVDEYDVVHDILVADDQTKKDIETMLERLDLVFKTYDISDLYLNHPNILGSKLVEDIDNFVKNSIILDDVLDRINEVGLENINTFEKKFLALQDGNDIKNS